MKSHQNLNSHRIYPIASALRSQLNWYQYRLLISISDSSKRGFYELERQINAQHQLLLPDARLLEQKIEEWVLEFEQNENTTHGATP